jgi:formate dehydrogenase subunit delta
MSTSQHLVQMANDIGNFFRAQPIREDAIVGIENHIKSFWTPRMRAKLCAELDQGDIGLDELPREALSRLRQNPCYQPDQPPGGDAG